VDSITPLLKASKSELEARAVLQNFFSELPRSINGLVLLIAETPMDSKFVELCDLEFVADVILFLKYTVENKLLSRYLEIRKARGSPITIAELPFTISEGKGVMVYEPVVLEEIPATRTEVLVPPCSVFSDIIGAVRKGEVTYITYPPDARPAMILSFIALAAIRNNIERILIMSYKSSPEDLKLHVDNELRRLGFSGESARKLIDKYFIFKSLNPTSTSPTQLNLLELKIIMEHNPDLVVFHGVDIPAAIQDTVTWRNTLLNQLLYLKKQGITVIRMGSYDDKYNYNASLADLVAKITTIEKIVNGVKTIEYEAYIWKRGASKPVVINDSVIQQCLAEIKEVLTKVQL
jgi:RecA-superfamily ATPases implicated in signal transduction